MTLTEKAAIVYQRLIELHGELERVPRREPMHELISTLLSHRTTEAQEARAFDAMMQRFGSYEAVRVAAFDELVEAIHGVNWPDTKAKNIQRVLNRIHEERGELSVAFLDQLPTDEALQWLLDLPGVGLKTATLVLLFCFGKTVLPVDTHLHRVSGRIGLIGAKVSAEKAHDQLLALLPSDAHVLYNFHIAMLRHGQKICVWKSPRCAQCPLTDICDYFQETQT